MTALALVERGRLVPVSKRDERLQHIARHLRYTLDVEGTLRMIPLLCDTGTYDDVAAAMGPGCTRRIVEYRVKILVDRLALPQGIGRTTNIARLALLRLLIGEDPCWCEA